MEKNELVAPPEIKVLKQVNVVCVDDTDFPPEVIEILAQKGIVVVHVLRKIADAENFINALRLHVDGKVVFRQDDEEIKIDAVVLDGFIEDRPFEPGKPQNDETRDGSELSEYFRGKFPQETCSVRLIGYSGAEKPVRNVDESLRKGNGSLDRLAEVIRRNVEGESVSGDIV